jgi:hypothetical protein
MKDGKLTFKELRRKHMVFNNPLADLEVEDPVERQADEQVRENMLNDQSDQEKRKSRHDAIKRIVRQKKIDQLNNRPYLWKGLT